MIILCLFFILFYLARLRNLNFRAHRKSGEIRGKYKIFHFELLTSTDIFHSLSLTLALTIVGHSNTRFYIFSGFLRISPDSCVLGNWGFGASQDFKNKHKRIIWMLHVLIAIKKYSAALHLHRKHQVRCHSEFPGLRKKLRCSISLSLRFHLRWGTKTCFSKKKLSFSYVYISKGDPYQFLAESSSNGDLLPG